MSRAFALAACLAALLIGENTAAQISAQSLEALTGEALTEAFSGKTMDGVYKQPRQRSGTTHFTETFHANGTTTYQEGPVDDKGFWATDEKRICFSYTGPLAGGLSCFYVYRIGTCLYSYGPSTIKNGWPIDANRWSVKTITRGDLSTCDNLVS